MHERQSSTPGMSRRVHVTHAASHTSLNVESTILKFMDGTSFQWASDIGMGVPLIGAGVDVESARVDVRVDVRGSVRGMVVRAREARRESMVSEWMWWV